MVLSMILIVCCCVPDSFPFNTLVISTTMVSRPSTIGSHTPVKANDACVNQLLSTISALEPS